MSSSQSNLHQEAFKARHQVLEEDRWNVESMYASWDEWEKELLTCVRQQTRPHWPEIARQELQQLTDPDNLRSLLQKAFNIERVLDKLYTYAHLRHDEDVAEETARSAYSRIMSFFHEFKKEFSWFEPQLLKLDRDSLTFLVQSEQLKQYKVVLEKIIRFKPHTLTEEMEGLLAITSKALDTAYKTFSVLNNADMQFPKAKDRQGTQKDLTHGTYHLYMRSSDRTLRESAFKELHTTFKDYENTFCELIAGQLQKHVLHARARGFLSCLDAAVFPHQIDRQVYTSLIAAVNQSLGSLHKYMKLRKELLGVDQLHLYDMYAPLVEEVNRGFSYGEAEKLVVESVFPLGAQYQSTLQQGLVKHRWVDRFENARKRSGAYSSGCYDSHPFILMNFHGTLNDVFTLAHEAGHSMHSYMSRKCQPYQYSQYPIFLAEVASTFHEELLMDHLMTHAATTQDLAGLICQKIDDIRATFFRQTMFAEFELSLHDWVERDIPLTPSFLRAEYKKLNIKYFGTDVVVDDEIDIEWARIPHFYYNFYVYQYATGLSASCFLAQKLRTEGELAKERYLAFLSSGSSRYPLDTLSCAGVDMRSHEPVQSIIRRFDELVSDLERLLKKK